MAWICLECGEVYPRARTRCPADGNRVVEDLSGRTIGGRYRLGELIGVGGMDGTVWKAWQTGTERTVAVKILPPADEAAAKRFARGARIAANLNHPNTTVIHDYGQTGDGKLYLVMEYLHGQVLQDLLTTEGMGVAETVHIASQILQALEHAHARRAVHRDLKPDNLFLTRRNEDVLHVKILDFGIAKYIQEEITEPSRASGGDSLADDDLVTEQRQVCGTPQYMAPEQVVGGRVDARTDIYSLGIVMYRMLMGVLPFDGKTRYELYQKHLQSAPPPFKAIRPDAQLPQRLELIIMKALAKSPGQRFQSATEMRKALASLASQSERPRTRNTPRVAAKPTAPQGKRKRGVTIAFDGVDVEPDPQPDTEPDVAAPPIPKASRPRGGALPDAVIRRSELGLKVLQPPRPSQTEPNQASQLEATSSADRARNWKVAIVLVGAFLIGVVGVFGVLKLTAKDAATPVTPSAAAQASANEAAAKQPAEPAPKPTELPGVASAAAAKVEAQPPAEESPERPSLEVRPPVTTASAEAPAPPKPTPPATRPELFELKIDSVPRGAEVRWGDEHFGATPTTATLPAGTHVLRLVRRGYIDEKVTISVDEDSRAEQLQRLVYLVRKVGTRARPAKRAGLQRQAPKVTTPDPSEPSATPTAARPKIQVLQDEAPPRKPKVDLLEDEAPPTPRKPNVQLLGE